MGIYPDKIGVRAASPRFAGAIGDANAVGTSASLTCGSFVRFSILIEPAKLVISDIKYETNGCGFAVAAAETIARSLRGKPLTTLHGLESEKIFATEEIAVTDFPSTRRQCADICLEAVRAALANFRASRVAGFTGGDALVCSCFGVDEKTIERVIDENSFVTVAEVTERTNAGAGCGSCRMMIEEILDGRDR